MKATLLVLALIVALGLLAFGVLRDFDPSVLSLHGWIALGLGTALSLLLGGGLMALVFYSARTGYDDRIEVDRNPDDPA